MAQITYDDKVYLNENASVPAINKVQDIDMNEIKSVINGINDGTDVVDNLVVGSIRTKNMLDLSTFPSQTLNGITFTNNQNGTITINGTATQDFGVTFVLFKIKAGNYYLSINESSTLPSVFYLYDHDSNVGFGNGAITLSQDYNKMGFDTWITNGTSFNNITISPQLETGSTATTYSAYQNLNPNVSDTGWVDLSSCVNTTNFTIRPGFTPKARRIGKTVYLKGSVYCSTAPNSFRGNLLNNIPTQFRPPEEIDGAGVKYILGVPYKIFCEGGDIHVSEGSNIPTTEDYQGYTLSDLGPYLVD